jgi:hypothetical protein
MHWRALEPSPHPPTPSIRRAVAVEGFYARCVFGYCNEYVLKQDFDTYFALLQTEEQRDQGLHDLHGMRRLFLQGESIVGKSNDHDHK